MNPRILIIDDSRLGRTRVQQLIERSGLCRRFVTACDGEEGLRALALHRIDLVICDLVMPKLDGFGLLQRMGDDPRLRGTPVIMLSGEDGLDERIRCLSAGATDFAGKDVHPAELIARVQAQLQLKALRDELELKNRELARLARVDSLTGIANRLAFMEGLAQEGSRSARDGGGLAVCIVDVDYFKQVNDSYGHAAGDKVLAEVADRLNSQVRVYDLTARLGGDEFGLLFTSTAPDDALALAERCRRVISREPVDFEGERIAISTSIGLACGPGGGDSTELLRRADDALFEAKRGGRDRVEMSPGPMPLYSVARAS